MGLVHRYILILAVVSAMGGLAACGGSGVNDGPDPGLELTSLEQLYESDTRLEDAGTPETSELFGRITLDGLTLADASATVAQTSQMVEELVRVRLLDPGDDILIANLNPDLTGHFSFATTDPVGTVHVEIGFEVAEDLDGDPETLDTVLQTVPVTFKPGKSVVMDMVISNFTAESTGDSLDKPGVMDALKPEEGSLLIVELVVEDANGYHEDLYGVNYFAETVVYDSDGDLSLEFGDDYITDDTDLDGMAGDFYTAIAAAKKAGAEDELAQGVITKTDSSAYTLTIKLGDGTLLQIKVDPLVAIEQIDSTAGLESSDFYGPLTLDASLVGKHCQAVVIKVGTEYYGRWVLVSDEPFAVTK